MKKQDECSHERHLRVSETYRGGHTGDIVCRGCGLAQHPSWWAELDKAVAR